MKTISASLKGSPRKQLKKGRLMLKVHVKPAFELSRPSDHSLFPFPSNEMTTGPALDRFLSYHRVIRSLFQALKSIEVSGYLTTYPSHKSTLTLTSHLGQNCDLREGKVVSNSETSTDLNTEH